jgi:hypothetical protein
MLHSVQKLSLCDDTIVFGDNSFTVEFTINESSFFYLLAHIDDGDHLALAMRDKLHKFSFKRRAIIVCHKTVHRFTIAHDSIEDCSLRLGPSDSSLTLLNSFEKV